DGCLLAAGGLAAPGYSREGPAAEQVSLIARRAVATGTVGEVVVSILPDGTIRRHDVDGKPLDRTAVTTPPSYIFVADAAFAPAAKRIALSDWDCICAKDAVTGRQLFRTVLPRGCICLAYSPAGPVLSAATWTGR